MRSEDIGKLLLSDTSIPDLFITEYMAGLSEVALKSYLFLVMGARGMRSIHSEKDLAARLGVSPEEIKGAVGELIFSGLVVKGEKGMIHLVDLKKSEIDGYIRNHVDHKSNADPKSIRPEDEERDNLTRSIEKTFFTGSMGYQWYREIDILLDDYHFRPEIVYRLFQDCYEKKQLRSLMQINERAILWQSKGITGLDELNAFLAKEEEVSVTLRKVGKILRRKTVSYDEDYVRVWIERLGYTFEIIDFAIKKVWEFQEPSINKADSYLKSWYAAGVRSLEDALAYEEDRARKNKLAYERDKSALRAPQKSQNFEGVRYDDGFLDSLDTDPSEFMRKINDPS